MNKIRHVFLQWNLNSATHSRNELKRLHLYFMYPVADQLFKLIKRTKAESETKSIQELMKKITSAKISCNELKPQPPKFN